MEITNVTFKDDSRGVDTNVNQVLENLEHDKQNYNNAIASGDVIKAEEIATTVNVAIDILHEVKQLVSNFNFSIPNKL